MSSVVFTPKYSSKYNSDSEKATLVGVWKALQTAWKASQMAIVKRESVSVHRSYKTRKEKEMAIRYE